MVELREETIPVIIHCTFVRITYIRSLSWRGQGKFLVKILAQKQQTFLLRNLCLVSGE
jgi:hypothetical protein